MSEMARLRDEVKKLLIDAEARCKLCKDDDSNGNVVASLEVLDLIEDIKKEKRNRPMSNKEYSKAFDAFISKSISEQLDACQAGDGDYDMLGRLYEMQCKHCLTNPAGAKARLDSRVARFSRGIKRIEDRREELISPSKYAFLDGLLAAQAEINGGDR